MFAVVTGLTPSLGNGPQSRGLTTLNETRSKKPPKHHISQWHHAMRFGYGLLPLRSPLLRESLLVSFPPLTDMLKFSGYSRLIWGQDCNKLTRIPKDSSTLFNSLQSLIVHTSNSPLYNAIATAVTSNGPPVEHISLCDRAQLIKPRP